MPQKSIRFRRANFLDTVAIKKIADKSAPYITPLPLIVYALLILLFHHSSFVVCIGKRQIGFAILIPMLTSYGWFQIAIKPEYRRKGFGTAFFKRIYSELNRPKLKALVKKANKSSLKWHKKLGFNIIGEIFNYWLLELK